MLRVITAEGVPVEVLLQAGIQFKNIVARGWQNMPDYPSLWKEEEKAPIREIVIEVRTCGCAGAWASPCVWVACSPSPPLDPRCLLGLRRLP
jgi:hypothetical protein